MARGGKLVFKGEEKAKKKKKSKATIEPSKNSASTGASNEQRTDYPSTTHKKNISTNTTEATTTSSTPSPSVTTGNGLVSTSGTVVTGHGTSFRSDLRAGDAIIARTERGEEMRVVTMVLSQISISVSSAFSVDLKVPTPYKFIVKPRDAKKERADRDRKANAEKEEVEARAMGTYGN